VERGELRSYLKSLRSWTSGERVLSKAVVAVPAVAPD